MKLPFSIKYPTRYDYLFFLLTLQTGNPIMNKGLIFSLFLQCFSLFALGQKWQNEPLLLADSNRKSTIYPVVLPETNTGNQDHSHSLIHRKLFQEHLIRIDSSDFELIIDPMLDWQLGKENSPKGTQNLYQNTRGFIAYGSLGKSFYFSTEYYENQAVPARYVKEYIDCFQAFPRQIRAKTFKTNGIDYAPVFGKIAWKPNNKYSITLGYDKIHIGQGYRSMILSTDAKPYPFLMNYYKRNKWAVGNINAVFYNTDIVKGNDTLMRIPASISGEYQRKWISVNWIEFYPTKFIEAGLADIIVCHPENNNGNHLYLSQIPIPAGIRPLLFNRHNLSVAALWINLYPTKNIGIYMQGIRNFSIHENNKIKPYQAWQLGTRYFAGKDNWHIAARAEYNHAGQFAYSSDNLNESHTNMGQSAAHPLGQNMTEVLLQLEGCYKRWFFSLSAHKINYRDFDQYGNGIGLYGYLYSAFSDPQKNTGNIILIAPGYKTQNINIAIGEFGYTINQSTNFQLFGRALYRQSPGNALYGGHTMIITAGIRHSLRRNNQDFY